MKDLYITQSGTLKRKDNSLIFKNEEIKKTIPVKNVNSIYAYGQININSKLLTFLSQMQIPVYFFNYYGFYTGAFYPRNQTVSGKVLVEQVKNYDNKHKRIIIAKEIVDAARHNMRKTLMQYKLTEESERLEKYEKDVNKASTINKLMGIEANIRKNYYKSFNKIIKNKKFKFIMRVKQPPDNFINCLISFGNSLLYTTTLSELFKTQLNPTVSYLHEPFERRYSLNLDVAEIFKPLIVDRVIFTLINQQMITEKDFDDKLNYCYLNESGRKIFLKEYDKKLNSSLKYPSLNRKVSYRYMLRLEGYKLIKYFIENKKYKAFKIYW
ncbi:type I-B CRISPR-associated endonuclease Cas1 [Candidatus Woesearchaeota archaeon]|nr:type I-B CRISPR-associated endonuclease Cas1 [Candidatus Woesearchaeota archaeon]